MGIEGRQFVDRCSERLRAELRVYYGPSQKTVLAGFSVDLSTGGLFLETEYPLVVNERLSLIFSMPNQEKSVSCLAKVAWCNTDTEKNDLPLGVGLQFVDLSLEDVKAITEFVENYDIEAAW